MAGVVKLGRDNLGFEGWCEFGAREEVLVFFSNGRNSVAPFFEDY